MYSKEKAKYIYDHGYPIIDNFYSDSLADTPLALWAENAYLVTDRATTVTEWPYRKGNDMVELRKKIDAGWSIHLKEDD